MKMNFRKPVFVLTLSFVLGLLATNLFAQSLPQESQVERLQRQIFELQSELNAIQSNGPLNNQGPGLSDPFADEPFIVPDASSAFPPASPPNYGNSVLDPSSQFHSDPFAQSGPANSSDPFGPAPSFDPSQIDPILELDEVPFSGSAANQPPVLPIPPGFENAPTQILPGQITQGRIEPPSQPPFVQARPLVEPQTGPIFQGPPTRSPGVIVSRPVRICPNTGRVLPSTLPPYVRETSLRVNRSWDYLDELRLEKARGRYYRGPYGR